MAAAIILHNKFTTKSVSERKSVKKWQW